MTPITHHHNFSLSSGDRFTVDDRETVYLAIGSPAQDQTDTTHIHVLWKDDDDNHHFGDLDLPAGTVVHVLPVEGFDLTLGD